MELYAFWKYDRPPYLLGGKVVRICDDGCVVPEQYGGYKFTPVKIVPLEAGLALQKKLDNAQYAYDEATQKALQDLKKVVAEISR